MDRQEYFRLRGVAQHKIKAAEKKYWQDYCSTLDSSSKISKVWGTVRKMSGVRSQPSIPTIIEGGVTYDNNHDKAELFARKFSAASSDDNLPADFRIRRAVFEQQIQSEETSRNQYEYATSPDEHDGINYPFESFEMANALRKCKSSSTPGVDRISYQIRKQIPRCC